jgi:hypothetical protein
MRRQREGLSGVSEKTILLVEDDRDQVQLAMRKHGIVVVARPTWGPSPTR